MSDKPIIRPGGRKPRSTSVSSQGQEFAGQRRRPSQNKINLATIAAEKRHAEQSNASALFRKYQAPSAQQTEMEVDYANPILALVSPLILLVSKVKDTNSNIELDSLKDHAISEVQYYQSVYFGLDHTHPGLDEISYGLCCLLDEIVLNTPWGAKSKWASQSLLVVFHKESWGGERFYALLDQMSENPSVYLDTIEFYYSAMELGFEGKYRDMQDGYRQYQIKKNNVFLLLEKYRELEFIPLSEKWVGQAEYQNKLLKTLPQWVLWLFTSLLLILIYAYFSLSLSSQTDPIKRQLLDLFDKGQVVSQPYNLSSVIDNTTQQLDLRQKDSGILALLLAQFSEEKEAGLIHISEGPKGIIFRLTNANLFGSGSDSLSTPYVAILKELSATLSSSNVRIEVSGHSDDIPIRTLRFPDNWALSEARAAKVKSILSADQSVQFSVTYRGLADTQNLVPNTSSGNRALNRRVEILIKG